MTETYKCGPLTDHTDITTSRKRSLLSGATTTSTPVGCAIYARYSDDGQNPNSIADQIRLCRIYAERPAGLETRRE
ncbi:recombinase family protein [Falsiroseomonas sp.]|nr:recombinase family protein [Falsiroseomonas sp.]MDP3417311.1 recombinase family protein [Falsiroseomonas sp.]